MISPKVEKKEEKKPAGPYELMRKILEKKPSTPGVEEEKAAKEKPKA